MFARFITVAAIAMGLCALAPGQDEQLRFEVASVKPNKSGGPGARIGRPSPLRWEAENAPLMFIIQDAWNLPQFRVTGGPDWLRRDRFDIQASMSKPASQEEMRLMMRNLLQERFGLKADQKLEDQPVYILSQTRRGAKIHPVAAGSCVTYDPQKPVAVEAGRSQPKWCGGKSYGPNQLEGTGITISEFVSLLGEVTHRVVFDETGLVGKFDINLKWVADERTPAYLAVPPTNTNEPGPSLFAILEDELGLSMNTGRRPVEVLVIQSAQQPSEN